MKNIILLLLSVVGFAVNINELPAVDLHAVIVVDTIGDLRTFTRPDLDNIRTEVRTIAATTGLHLKEKILADGLFEQKAVVDCIRDLKVKSQDVVLFYFSGHGYRTRVKDTCWPFLYFGCRHQTIDLNYIANVLRSKHPRFALVIADCCNNYIEERDLSPDNETVSASFSWEAISDQGYRRLFLESKGLVIVAGCREGEYSYGCHRGGFFTNYFLMSLNRELSSPRPGWDNLLKRTSYYIGNLQTPRYMIYKD